MQETTRRRPRNTSTRHPMQQVLRINILDMWSLHAFLLHRDLTMTTPCMIHRRGTATLAGVELHLGQKPKLGGRYTGITHSLHIMISGYLYILVLFV